jgi:hypothetical protein
MKKIILVLICLLFWSGVSWAGTYYIRDVAGTLKYRVDSWPDADNGTTAADLQTAISALDAATPINTLVLDATGTSWTGANGKISFASNGMYIRSPIASDPDYATYGGTVTIGPPATATYTILSNGKTDISVTGPMIVIGASSYTSNAAVIGVFLAASSNVIIDNLDIRSMDKECRGFWVSSATGSGNIIRNCTITNRVCDWTSESCTVGSSDYGIDMTNSNNWTISNNTIGTQAYRFWKGVYGYNSDSNTITGNYITWGWNGADYPSATGNGITLDGTSENNLITRNIVYKSAVNYNVGGTSRGNKIYFNLSNSAIVNNFDHWANNAGLAANEFYNNTAYHRPTGSAGHGFASQQYNGVSKWRNNLCDGYSAVSGPNCFGISGTSPVVDIDYNVYHVSGSCGVGTGSTTLSDWQTAISTDARFTPGKETHSVSSDPLFTNAATGDFTLLPNSPAIHAGTRVTGVHDTGLSIGYVPVTVPEFWWNNPSIGAYEVTPLVVGSRIIP